MDQNSYGKEFLGKGFKFPVRIDSTTGRFLTSSYEDDIKEAIYIILMTRKGERLMHPDFGCDIYDYAFSSMNFTNLSQMENSVREALMQWEPRIEDVEVYASADAKQDGLVNINIDYTVISTNSPDNMVFPFYINR